MVKKGLILGGILVAVSGIFVSNTFAESANTDFNIKVNPSLSLSVSSSNVGFSLTPTQAGSYDSASFIVYSSTNNPTGYKLIMSTNKVDLESNTINPTTGTKPTIPTLAETQEGITAAAFEASTSSDVLNHWGVSVAGANYNVMKSTQEIKKTTVNNVTVDTTAISLASKLDLLTVPGVYSTTINFQIVDNMYTTGGSIGDDGRYPANSLLRAFEIAYTQAGKPMYIEDSNTDIGWRPMVGADFDTVGGKEVRFAMQDISMTFEENGQTKNVCEWAQASATDSSYIDVAEVMDLRDGTSYHIVKAADNRCWLADNLALDPTLSIVQANLTPVTTNASQAAITNYLTSSGTAPQPGWSTEAVSYENSNSTNVYPRLNIASKTVVPQSNSDPLKAVALEQGWKIGAYYNYCAASIGTYCHSGGSGIDIDENSAVDAEYDICPAGWRMPTGGPISSSGTSTGGGEYQTLSNAYSNQISNVRRALRFPLSGVFFYGTRDSVGSYGKFWSSTYYSDGSNMYTFLTNGSGYNLQDTYIRRNAASVRCIAK